MIHKEDSGRERLRQAMAEACAADCWMLGESTEVPPGLEERMVHRLWTEERRRRRRSVWIRAVAAAMVVVVAGLTTWTALTGLERFTERPEREYMLDYVPATYAPTYRYTSSENAYTRWADSNGTAQLVLLQNSTSVDALLDLRDCAHRTVDVAGRRGTLYTKAGYAALTWSMDDYYFTMVFNGADAAEMVLTLAERMSLK